MKKTNEEQEVKKIKDWSGWTSFREQVIKKFSLARTDKEFYFEIMYLIAVLYADTPDAEKKSFIDGIMITGNALSKLNKEGKFKQK